MEGKNKSTVEKSEEEEQGNEREGVTVRKNKRRVNKRDVDNIS